MDVLEEKRTSLILSNFTDKNSDRILRPGICIDITHRLYWIASKNLEYDDCELHQQLFSLIDQPLSWFSNYIREPVKNSLGEKIR